MSLQARKQPFITQWDLDQALGVLLVFPVAASFIGGVAAGAYLSFWPLVVLSVVLVYIAQRSFKKIPSPRWRGSFARTALASSVACIGTMWGFYLYRMVAG